MVNKAKAADPISNLEADELAIVLKPIYTLLTAAQQPGANAQTVLQALNVADLQELANVPAIETIGIGGIAAIIQQKLQAWQASVVAGASSAGGAASDESEEKTSSK